MIFDSHTHLNAEQFEGIVPEIVKNARELDVTQMACVGFNKETIELALSQAKTYDGVYAIIGWHPEDAGTYSDEVEDYLRTQLTTDKVVGVGEMGLDYHWDTAPHSVQQDVFRRQIQLAKKFNLPISIHNREATEDVYEVLKSEDISSIGGIMHSFNLEPSWAKKFLDLGMHLSFSGVLTFKNAPEVRESAAYAPSDRILVETDAPYMTPEPYRGKRNEPGYTRYVVERLAEVRDISFEEAAKLTSNNAKKLFKITD